MREHSSVFRQSGEVCLIWLHDIPHISYWAQRPLFALMLTSLSSHALAVTLPWLSCLVLCTNSPTKFTFSPPTHASCCIYLFLSLLLSSVLSCFILPYPANLMSLLSPPLSPANSLSILLPPPPSLSCQSSLSSSSLEVSYDAGPESSAVFNYINKTPYEVQWPRTQQHPLPCNPQLYPFLFPCCSAGLGLLRLPAGPVQLVPGCISWLIERHVFLPL